MDNKLQREAQFHDERFGGDDSARLPTTKYYSLMRAARECYDDRIASMASGNRLLEYGCGTGGNAIALASVATSFTGIDISPEGIKKAAEHATKHRIAAEYYVMNAEEMRFADNSFDLVMGTGILHHLDLSKAYCELARVLSQNGHAIFIEPLGHNPLINLYRRLTPSMRTEDEHPLRTTDLLAASAHFKKVDAIYFNLFTFLSIPFRKTKIFESLVATLGKLDAALFSLFPILKRYAWMVVLDLSEPRNR